MRLTESGCRDDGGRCDVGYRIRLPKAMSAQINAQAGAVMVNGLAGDLHVATLAGSVEGRGLTSAEVSVRTQAGETTLTFAEAPDWSEPPPDWGQSNSGCPGTRPMRLMFRRRSAIAASTSTRTPHRRTVSRSAAGSAL